MSDRHPTSVIVEVRIHLPIGGLHQAIPKKLLEDRNSARISLRHLTDQ
jgi:hypothetical protein